MYYISVSPIHYILQTAFYMCYLYIGKNQMSNMFMVRFLSHFGSFALMISTMGCFDILQLIDAIQWLYFKF